MSATIVASHSPPQIEPVRALFREYADSIANVAACSLQYQHFDDELAGLPGRYAPPRGAIFLAYDDTVSPDPVGCVALRPLPDQGSHVCELKRMYVRPAARNRGIGRLLAQRIIEQAATAGYTLLKLDTSSSMVDAQRLYRSLGFVPCEAYNNDPAADTLWFERVVRAEDART